MSLHLNEAWVAIIAMGLVTFVTRALPFLFKRNLVEGKSPNKKSPLNALGPSLLTAIAVVAIMPDLQHAAVEGAQQFMSYLVSLLATLAVLRFSKSAGLALIVGVACYALSLFVAGMV
ncbi:AzlD domain-containing protein [Pseudomonas koreensis]